MKNYIIFGTVKRVFAGSFFNIFSCIVLRY